MFKIIVDFHVHSSNSFDGKDTMHDMCKGAIANGIDELCFTEHVSFNPFDPSYNFLDYHIYSMELERCRDDFQDKLLIYKGLEIGEGHVQSNGLDDLLKNKDLDFVIGSVHNIGNLKLRNYMKGKEKNGLYQGYFNEVYKLVENGDIDVLGHLDLMKRYAFRDFGNYHMENVQLIIEDILKKAIDRNIGIEVNTSGLRNSVKEIFPSMEILKKYKSFGGEIVTLGSDAHSKDHVGYKLDSMYKLLRDMDFKYVYKYSNRVPFAIKIGGA